MKTAFFSLFALATSVIAGPVVTENQLAPRQLESQADQLDTLLALVQTHTANINSTTAAVQDNPSVDQQNAAAAALAPDFNAITSALTSATTLLAKRAWEDTVLFVRTGGDGKGDGGHGGGKDGPNKSCAKECLLVKIELLVWEIACTIKLVIIKLGLACVLQILTPLLLALVGLIKALDKVVLGLVIVVKALLHTILGTVAGALLALIIW
ncbi:hypothetical protein QBC40DRAFT_329395 [Triangularia verruculosa]|uniref:Uncharacterized protein n=1 Tax=Triangularia verruculosa TaxID=2587418 RepID=A0AAN7AVR4_9PEZI|nr:hypothetical protein QBC40DRAFT_329395 [Triangularia verruculosa]